MKAYSEDLRKKIVDAVTEHGTKESEASYAFRASYFFVKRYVRLVEVGKPLIPKKKRISQRLARPQGDCWKRSLTNARLSRLKSGARIWGALPGW